MFIVIGSIVRLHFSVISVSTPKVLLPIDCGGYKKGQGKPALSLLNVNEVLRVLCFLSCIILFTVFHS